MARGFSTRLILCIAVISLLISPDRQVLAEANEPVDAPSAEVQPTTQPAAQQVAMQAAILEPTQGRPRILQRQDQFWFLLRLGDGIEGTVTLSLRYCRVPSLMFDVIPVQDMAIIQQRYASMTLRIPENIPLGMYDLVVKSASKTLVARSSIKVVDTYKTKFRFVHLSDMTVGDPSAPAFDDRLVEEVNLLAPEFIVATGDYTAWGRMLDDETSWQPVLDYFTHFDAPVYMVCGDNDHETSFFQYVAQTPLGTFDYGGYHGILLWNHALHPIDDMQIDFLRRDLDAPRQAVTTMIVTHSDDLGFLDQLAKRDSLADYLRQRKVKMVIAGGSDDWDQKEYADSLEGLDLHYIRTHQASTCLRGRATGVSHYRVVEVDGDKVSYVYPEEDVPAGKDHSVPVGRLRVFRESSTDQNVALSIQNALNASFENACVWVTVAKSDTGQDTKVAGGKLLQTIDAGQNVLCQIGVDLPDKGGVKVMVTTDKPLPQPIPVQVEYQGEQELAFAEKQTQTGLSYYESDQPVRLILTNSGDQPVSTYPIVRLNGSVLPIEIDGQNVWPIEIPASGQVTLTARVILSRISPGEHEMQVIFLEDPVRRVTVFPVTLTAK